MLACCDVSRPPLPASTFVTIAIRPSSRGGMRGRMKLIWGEDQAEYFSASEWTRGIALKAQTKLAFARSASRGRTCAAGTRIDDPPRTSSTIDTVRKSKTSIRSGWRGDRLALLQDIGECNLGLLVAGLAA